MRCPTCGYPIELTDQQRPERCPNCGNPLFPPQSGDAPSASPPEYHPYPPYPAPNVWAAPGAVEESGSGYGAPAPASGYGQYGQPGQYGGAYGSYAPPSGYGQPAPPSGYGQPAPPSGYGQYGSYGSYAPPSGYGQPAPPSYPYAPGYASPGYPRPPLAPLPERKRRTGLIVTIVALVVAVLAACTGGTILAIRTLGPTQATNIPAPTAPTGGSPSSSTSLTATPTVIYQNTFSATSDSSGWAQDAGHCFSGTGGYHVEGGYLCYAPVGLQSDVTVSVTVQQVAGPTTYAYGVVLRRASTGNFYQFMIDSNGKWLFAKCVNEACTRPDDFTQNNAIKGGLNTSNTLMVSARGSHFDLFVNNTKVGSVDDTTFTSGKIGLVAGASIECSFTNLVISRPA